MPKCSCLGKNPECFKCGGWGWIGDTIHENRRLDDPLKFAKSTKGNKSTRDKSCPFCSRMFANLHQHVSVAHDDKWNQYLKESDANDWLEDNKKERCLFCGMFVNKLKKHLRKVHTLKKYENELNILF